jgi:hypothetical protein
LSSSWVIGYKSYSREYLNMEQNDVLKTKFVSCKSFSCFSSLVKFPRSSRTLSVSFLSIIKIFLQSTSYLARDIFCLNSRISFDVWLGWRSSSMRLKMSTEVNSTAFNNTIKSNFNELLLASDRILCKMLHIIAVKLRKVVFAFLFYDIWFFFYSSAVS